MKKGILFAVILTLTCVAGLAGAGREPEVPAPVATRLSQNLEMLEKKPGVLEKSQSPVLGGVRYLLPFSGGELQLYTYRTADEAARDLRNVSGDGFQVGEVYVDWTDAPHFFLRDNVVVLYVGEDLEVLDMLERLCGAQIRGTQSRL